MDFKKYMNMPNAQLSDEMKIKLEKQGGITKVEFSNKNMILANSKLWSECGYTKLAEGTYLVSMVIAMPDVTKEMVSWWFWWHAQNSKRYRVWYPKEHYKISYSKQDKEYFNSKIQPPFQTNTQYPVERLGKFVAPLSIKFVSPVDFGFNEKLMEQNNVETIVCGHVGAFKGLINNTEMAHIFVQKEDGSLWISRFWLGENLKSNMLKKIFITEKQARNMAIHCFIEYSNFSKKIPMMYNEWFEINT